MANIIYKDVLMCRGFLNIPLDFNFLSVNWWIDVIGGVFPAQMNASLDILHHYSAVNINTTTLGSLGLRVLSFNVREGNGGAILGTYDIWIEVTDECITESEVCCNNAINLRWLSVTGGIKEWVFPGVREFEVRAGDAPTFKNSALQIQYSERKDIYLGKSVNTTRISREQYEYVVGLKTAIQAWEWDADTETATPILIDNESFLTYKTNSKFFELSAKYVIAAESIIQTQ